KRVLQRGVDAGLGPADRVLRPLVPAKSIGGGLEVTPISEAVAYSTLVNHGVRSDPRSILVVRSGGSGATDSGDVVFRAPKPRGTVVPSKSPEPQPSKSVKPQPTCSGLGCLPGNNASPP